MFWGFLFLAVGVLLIIQHVFNINLPILKILFGLFLIYLGVKVIFGSFGVKVSGFNINKVQTRTEAVFTESEFSTQSEEGKEFNSNFTTAFGNSYLNLENLSDEDLKNKIYITNAFGKSRIKTSPKHGIKAEISVGFGSVKIRGQKLGSLGEIDYKSPNYNPDGPNVRLEIDNAFGDVEIE